MLTIRGVFMETKNTVKENKTLMVKNLGKCIGCYSCMIACATRVHKNFSLNKSAILIKTSGGYQGRVVVNTCRGCENPNCVESCTEGALSKRIGGGVVFEKNMCIGCSKCITGCTVGAIRYDKEEKNPIVCIQCGLCAEVCPHNVIEMEMSI